MVVGQPIVNKSSSATGERTDARTFTTASQRADGSADSRASRYNGDRLLGGTRMVPPRFPIHGRGCRGTLEIRGRFRLSYQHRPMDQLSVRLGRDG